MVCFSVQQFNSIDMDSIPDVSLLWSGAGNPERVRGGAGGAE